MLFIGIGIGISIGIILDGSGCGGGILRGYINKLQHLSMIFNINNMKVNM
jgi:hypothetical protein